MPLPPGSHLGPYEITTPLGAGGMGEVYRARDTRLERNVAIKILPEQLSKDPTRKQRFEREAKAISSLNHPHICTLHDIGSQDGIDYLVMECVEGETLAKRLEKGPLSLEQVLKYGVQIADALDRAHRAGIVHRDLKPGNIMLTATGAKLLDFGLAKPTAAASLATMTATKLESPVTQEGTIVGTFQYMSPEQVEGKEVDGRSDIFSLGAVLYEMLTGQRAFEGKSQLSVASAILEKEPIPISTLKPLTPPVLDHTLRKCLAKHPDERWQSASDLASELNWVAEGSSQYGALAVTPSRVKHREWLAWTLAVLGLGAAALFWAFGVIHKTPALLPKHLLLRLPADAPVALARLAPLGIGRTSFALSPDGTTLVYAADLGKTSQLYVRPLDKSEPRPLPGTQGAYGPFFSPDGQWVGFFANDRLKKISLLGGDPVVICETRIPHGGTWGSNGQIVFSDGEGSVLVQVLAAGGKPRNVPDQDLSPGQGIYSPELLPDAKWVLASIPQSANWDFARIVAISLETGKAENVFDGGTSPHYVRTGHLLFTRGKTLMAAPFDPRSRKITGAAVTLLDGVKTEAWGAAQFAVSGEGTLAYLAGGAGWIGKLAMVDRKGSISPFPLPAQAYGVLNLSPDGRFVAVLIGGPADDVWIYDIGRAALTRFTTDGADSGAIWSPDSRYLVMSSVHKGKTVFFRKLADGSGAEEPLLTTELSGSPQSWSAAGNFLAFTQTKPAGVEDIWTLPLQGERTPRLFLQTNYDNWGAVFSPDGRWIAYTSNESGRSEVFVRPYPGPGGKWQVSTEGGEEPRWAKSGRELFYRNGTNWMSARVQTSTDFAAQKPEVMFEGNFVNVLGIEYDVAPDGNHFIMIQADEPKSPPTELNVIVNWFELLNRQIAAR
jgi:Tol biopolymer transport system component/tRNA A-37 threonylcarbamoyl transferase component Bud32